MRLISLSIIFYRWKPQFCTAEDCHYYLGGTHNPDKKHLDAHLISDNIASVRKNVTGAPIRVIVDLKQNKVRNFEVKLQMINYDRKNSYPSSIFVFFQNILSTNIVACMCFGYRSYRFTHCASRLDMVTYFWSTIAPTLAQTQLNSI